MAEVIEINTPEELAGYRMAWRALLDETPSASFFHTFNWFSAFWKHYGAGHRMRVLAVRAAGRIIGIVPLMVKRERRRFGWVRVLTYPLDGWGAVYSPVGGAQAATLALAMRWLAEAPRDWDLIDLPWVDDAGADRGRTENALAYAGLRVQKHEHESCSYIDTRGGWEAYLAGLDAKTRHESRRTLRRIEELGGARLIRRRPAPAREGDGSPDWRTYDACEAVARESWQAGLREGNTLSHTRCRGFLRECHAEASRLGMADMAVLEIEGRPAAFFYNYHYRGVVFGLRMGYRPEFRRLGVGKALLLMMTRDSCLRGDERIDLGPGEQDYKRRLRTGCEQSYRLTHTPWNSWRSQAVRLSHWARAGRAPEERRRSIG